ncbi:phage integrase [Calothrix sp. NIES-2098]|nr:phage integrase [Calothrix sp. NIES-2098]
MYDKPSQGKTPKGSVAIVVSHGRLQLRFRHAGKRHNLSIGLPDTKVNRKAAEGKKAQIELDIASGNFDPTLKKYKPESALTLLTPEITPQIGPPKITEIWQGYIAYKSSSLKETTKGYHNSFTKLFELLGDIQLLDAVKVKASLEKITTVHQTKRALIQLNAACKWGVKHGLIGTNPYVGMANEMPKYRYQLEPKPNAFTEEEREQIIEAFKNHRGNWNGRGYTGISYAHYASFVEFLFLTGCRPSEAIGLQWKHISEDCGFIRFEGSVTTSGNGIPTRVEGSKNNKKRQFSCSERLRKLLVSIKPENPNPESLVFPSPQGKVITYNNFCNNAWDRIVDPIKPDTTPYSCRDTFITLQIIKGIPESVIAGWCDTSVEMIEKHYADSLKMLSLRPID